MSDEKGEGESVNPARICLSNDNEVRDWARKFGVTEAGLRRAVQRVGSDEAHVRRELGGRR